MVIKENISLILGGGPTQGLDDRTLTAEAKCPTNFTQSRKRFVLTQYYNESKSFLFLNATEAYRFKVKHSETKYHALCSKDFTINNMKKNN